MTSERLEELLQEVAIGVTMHGDAFSEIYGELRGGDTPITPRLEPAHPDADSVRWSAWVGALAETVDREMANVNAREVTTDYGRGMKDGMLEALLAFRGKLRAKMASASNEKSSHTAGGKESNANVQ